MRERHKQEQGILSKENDCCRRQAIRFPSPFAPRRLASSRRAFINGPPTRRLPA